MQGNQECYLPPDDIIVPFRSLLPKGHNVFSVYIPETLTERNELAFYLSDLRIYPNLESYVSIQEQRDPIHKLQSQEVFDVSVTIKADFAAKGGPYYEFINRPGPPHALMEAFNLLGQVKLPKDVYCQPVFVDWTYKAIALNVAEKYRESFVGTDEFYNQVLDMRDQLYGMDITGKLPEHHIDSLKNTLPRNVKAMKGVNGLIAPTRGDQEGVRSNIRYRLHVAPYMKAKFNSIKQLERWGFDKEQFEKQGNLYVLDNSSMGYKITQAKNAPVSTADAAPSTYLNVGIFPSGPSTGILHTRIIDLEGFDGHRGKLKERINASLKEVRELTNLNIHLGYDQETGRFSLTLPDPENFEVQLNISEKLASALGSSTNIINYETQFKNTNVSYLNTYQAEKALDAFRTGMVMALSESSGGGNESVTMGKRTVAWIFPRRDGTMSLERSALQDFPPQLAPSLNVPGYKVVNISLVRFKDGLPSNPLKIDDYKTSNEIIKFGWKDDAIVYGVVVGKHYPF